MRRGFSLVELSIVLVILGLLVGGVLAGQSLIRAAELRSAGTESSKYITAAMAFKDKYFALPGDFGSATRIWGRYSTTSCATNSSAAVVATGVCDGDATGALGWAGAASISGETFQFWRQLALAGLIEGDYPGISGAAGCCDPVPGTNTPTSRLSSAGWSAYTMAIAAGGSSIEYAKNYGNFLTLGGYTSNQLTRGKVLKPEEAWNIDTKLDDGLPGTGRVVAYYWNSDCASSTTNSDYTGTYRLSDSTLRCALIFANAF